MFCPKCGNTLPDNATFCNNCGTALNNPARYNAPKSFSMLLKAKTTGIILKIVALCNLLFAFIFAIIVAAGTGSALSYYGGGGGGFGMFMLIFFIGLVLSGILYGIGDIIERQE